MNANDLVLIKEIQDAIELEIGAIRRSERIDSNRFPFLLNYLANDQIRDFLNKNASNKAVAKIRNQLRQLLLDLQAVFENEDYLIAELRKRVEENAKEAILLQKSEDERTDLKRFDETWEAYSFSLKRFGARDPKSKAPPRSEKLINSLLALMPGDQKVTSLEGAMNPSDVLRLLKDKKNPTFEERKKLNEAYAQYFLFLNVIRQPISYLCKGIKVLLEGEEHQNKGIPEFFLVERAGTVFSWQVIPITNFEEAYQTLKQLTVSGKLDCDTPHMDFIYAFEAIIYDFLNAKHALSYKEDFEKISEICAKYWLTVTYVFQAKVDSFNEIVIANIVHYTAKKWRELAEGNPRKDAIRKKNQAMSARFNRSRIEFFSIKRVDERENIFDCVPAEGFSFRDVFELAKIFNTFIETNLLAKIFYLYGMRGTEDKIDVKKCIEILIKSDQWTDNWFEALEGILKALQSLHGLSERIKVFDTTSKLAKEYISVKPQEVASNQEKPPRAKNAKAAEVLAQSLIKEEEALKKRQAKRNDSKISVNASGGSAGSAGRSNVKTANNATSLAASNGPTVTAKATTTPLFVARRETRNAGLGALVDTLFVKPAMRYAKEVGEGFLSVVGKAGGKKTEKKDATTTISSAATSSRSGAARRASPTTAIPPTASPASRPVPAATPILPHADTQENRENIPDPLEAFHLSLEQAALLEQQYPNGVPQQEVVFSAVPVAEMIEISTAAMQEATTRTNIPGVFHQYPVVPVPVIVIPLAAYHNWLHQQWVQAQEVLYLEWQGQQQQRLHAQQYEQWDAAQGYYQEWLQCFTSMERVFQTLETPITNAKFLEFESKNGFMFLTGFRKCRELSDSLYLILEEVFDINAQMVTLFTEISRLGRLIWDARVAAIMGDMEKAKLCIQASIEYALSASFALPDPTVYEDPYWHKLRSNIKPMLNMLIRQAELLLESMVREAKGKGHENSAEALAERKPLMENIVKLYDIRNFKLAEPDRKGKCRM